MAGLNYATLLGNKADLGCTHLFKNQTPQYRKGFVQILSEVSKKDLAKLGYIPLQVLGSFVHLSGEAQHTIKGFSMTKNILSATEFLQKSDEAAEALKKCYLKPSFWTALKAAKKVTEPGTCVTDAADVV